MPIFYECDRCTACCRWPGQVRLRPGETEKMAAHLGLSEQDFVNRFARLNASRTGLALADKENGECILLENGGCRVNPVKPQQCRNFPNLWNFPGFENICQARELLLDGEEYRAAIERATGVKLAGQ
jgi:Fe-S-cluster containining protein